MKTWSVKRKAWSVWRSPHSAGFTLVELLLAMMIMAVIITAVYETWNSGITALKRARDITEHLQRERALLDILARSFRTATFSQENATWYAWQCTDNGDADEVSFVATDIPAIGQPQSSGAVPQRIDLALAPDNTGQLVLQARVMNFLANDIDTAGKTITLADWVKSFNVRYYDADNDEWLDTWDNGDNMPTQVELTLTMASSNPAQPDVTFAKLIQIPATAAAMELGMIPTGDNSSVGNTGNTGNTGNSGNTGNRGNTSGGSGGGRGGAGGGSSGGGSGGSGGSKR